jgi:ATP-dependent DNA helicase 2 subunit 1
VETKRIILFTNQDQPHSDNIDLQRAVQTKATDLKDNGIDINVLGIDTKQHQFNPAVFYQDLGVGLVVWN